jgi:hypothetical protein
MSWFRRRKGALEDWSEAIRPELRELPAPPPSDTLLDRIIASRANGSRMILPDAPMPPRHSTAPLLFTAALAAVLVLVLLPLVRDRGPDPLSPGPEGEPVASQWFTGTVAFATTAPAGQSLRPIQLSHADRLRPVTLVYERTRRDSAGAVTGRTRGVVAMTRDMVDGVPAWRLVAHDSAVLKGKAGAQIDTIVVAQNDLRPLRRTTLVAPYLRYDEIRIRQSFRADSVTGRMNARGADATAAGRPIARLLPPAAGPYVADAFVPVLLGAVELHTGWSGRASLIGWAVVDGDVFFPVELRVDGEEQISVPAGRFDCWRLSVRYPRGELSYWVRKSDGLGVRLVQRGRASDPSREMVLVRLSTGG